MPKSYIDAYLKNEIKRKESSTFSESEDSELNHSTNTLKKKKSDTDILRKKKSFSNSARYKSKKFGSFKKLVKIKGILKQSRRSISKTNSDINNNTRRVSFGWRDESY